MNLNFDMYISLYQPYTDTMMMNKDNHCSLRVEMNYVCSSV